ncbi:MAG: hypothetical protein HC900_03700, partial [Methylacidiphilales bacterium]|nr:hypothetical protein [Candidatus Methylacidiphilales bacterium]
MSLSAPAGPSIDARAERNSGHVRRKSIHPGRPRPPRHAGASLGGGPRRASTGVISAVTIEAIEQGMQVVGFLDGFKWLVEGSTEHNVSLEIDVVKQINLRGGSILRTSRTNPTKND